MAPNRDKENYRLDATDAMIYRDKRENTDMAWEVDHIFPYEILEFFWCAKKRHKQNREFKGYAS